MVICTLGDLLMDVVVRPDGAAVGGDDRHARIATSVGGQAANVAAWAAHLGAQARVVAVRATDAIGRVLEQELAERRVTLCGPRVEGVTGTVVSLVDGVGERSMLSDRGVSPTFAPDQLDPVWFTGIDRLHITGYALLAEPFAGTAIQASRVARQAGARVSVDLSAAHLIDAVGPAIFARRLQAAAPEVLFGTEREFARLGAPPQVAVTVVKRGALGCTMRWVDGECEIPPPRCDVVDSTGAGDAFAAGFLVGTTRQDAIERARAAAGACLARIGAMPPRERQQPRGDAAR